MEGAQGRRTGGVEGSSVVSTEWRAGKGDITNTVRHDYCPVAVEGKVAAVDGYGIGPAGERKAGKGDITDL